MQLTDLMYRPGLMSGERILVTGGGTGLGKEMAEAFLLLGARVYIIGRRGGVLQQTADALNAAHADASGGYVSGLACDIRAAEAISDTLDQVWADGGALTGLVNNAAGNFISRTEDLSPRGFDAIANIVFRGSFFMTLDCGKRWIAEGVKASVLSILTTWVWNGGPFTVPSAMSKAGLNAMTQSLAVEWGGKVRLNAIAPGPFPDRRHERATEPRLGGRGLLQHGQQSPGAGRADGGACEPRRLPDGARVGVRERPDDRHRRRRLPGDGRQLRRPARLGRRALDAGARDDQEHQREGSGAADRLSGVNAPFTARAQRPGMRRLAFLIALLIASPTLAGAQSVAAGAKQTPVPAGARLRSPADDPALSSPGLRRLPVVVTARLGRDLDDAAALCRGQCAPPHHECLAENDRSRCNPRWVQCISACARVPSSR
jgi:NAD(P)-dependent dehydrogenase (short-subunit alcohol dehydrogenase family)